MGARRCPTPRKATYWSKARAIRVLRYATRSRWSLERVYRCPCGAWHLTSQGRNR